MVSPERRIHRGTVCKVRRKRARHTIDVPDYRRMTMKVAGCFSSGRWILPAFIVSLAFQPVMASAQTAARSDRQQVTYSKDVAPIFNRSCVRCHRPEEIAPMLLLTYKEERPWASSIKERVGKQEIQPW